MLLKKKVCLALIAVPVAFSIAALIYTHTVGEDSYVLVEGVALSCAGICAAVWFIFSKNSHAIWFLVGAFIMSVAGDCFMKTRGSDDLNFILGISFFFIAHVGFLIYALRRVKFSWIVFAVVTVPLTAVYFAVFMPSKGLWGNWLLTVFGFIYLLVSSFSFSATVKLKGASKARWIYTIAIASLLISDILIAVTDFLQVGEIEFLIMPLYYLCHILVALSVVFEYSAKKDEIGGDMVLTDQILNS